MRYEESNSGVTTPVCPNCNAPLGENAAKCDYCQAYCAGATAGDGALARENRRLVLAGATALLLGTVVSVVSLAHRSVTGRNGLATTSCGALKRATDAGAVSPMVPPLEPPTAVPFRSPSTCPDIPPISTAMAAAKAASTTEAKIRILRDFLALCPQVYSFEIHNELRHYLSTIDPKASMAQSDIILRENPMHDYIVHILANWVDPTKDPHGAVDALIDTMAVEPSLVYVQAACHYRAAQILASIDDSAGARAHLLALLTLRGAKMEPYHRRAQSLLARLAR